MPQLLSDLRLFAGSAAAPPLAFVGDPDTGIFSPAADELGFAVGGDVGWRMGHTAGIGRWLANSTFAGALAGAIFLRTNVDTVDRFLLTANGTMGWGDGTNARDVSLARSGPGVLKVDGSLLVPGGNSDSDVILDTGYNNYGIWVDNVGSGTAGRMWLNAPHDGEIVLGPRSGADVINRIRLNGYTRLDGTGEFLKGIVVKAEPGNYSADINIESPQPELQFIETDLDNRWWFHANDDDFYLLWNHSGGATWSTPHPMKVVGDGLGNLHSIDFGAVVNLAGEGWKNLPFSSGWSNYAGGGGYAAAQYRKLPDGSIEVRGLVTSSTTSSTIGVLPDGYRPPFRLMFATIGNGNVARVDVASTGAIILSTGSGSSYLSLDPIRFYAG